MEAAADPILGSFKPLDNIARVLREQLFPLRIFLEDPGIADDHEPVLSSSNAYIDAIILFNKASWSSPHHRDEDKFKLSSL